MRSSDIERLQSAQTLPEPRKSLESFLAVAHIIEDRDGNSLPPELKDAIIALDLEKVIMFELRRDAEGRGILPHVALHVAAAVAGSRLICSVLLDKIPTQWSPCTLDTMHLATRIREAKAYADTREAPEGGSYHFSGALDTAVACSAIGVALQAKNSEVAELLVNSRKLLPDLVERNRYTHVALEDTGDAKVDSMYKITALDLAAAADDPKMVRLMLTAEASRASMSSSGAGMRLCRYKKEDADAAAPEPHWSLPNEGPLAIAVERRSQSVLRLLLEKGFLLSLESRVGLWSRVARTSNHIGLAMLLAGVPCEEVTPENIHRSLNAATSENVRLLLSRRPDLAASSFNSTTPLIKLAYERFHVESDVDVINKAETVIAFGGNVNATRLGRTALDYALGNGMDALAQLIKKAGGKKGAELTQGDDVEEVVPAAKRQRVA